MIYMGVEVEYKTHPANRKFSRKKTTSQHISRATSNIHVCLYLYFECIMRTHQHNTNEQGPQ